MHTISFALDLTGALIARPLNLSDTQVVLTAILTRAETQRADGAIPDDLAPRFDALHDTLSKHLEHVVALSIPSTAAPADLPELPPHLLRLAPAETLVDTRLVNHLIDALVRSLDRVLEGFAALDHDPLAPPARLLRDRFFADGRGYLRYDNAQQWATIDRLFGDLTEAEHAALDAVGRAQSVADIVALNAHFGDLLNITSSDPATPPPSRAELLAQAHSDTRRLLGAWIHLANTIAPSDTEADVALRHALIGPYIDTIAQAVRARSASARRFPTPASEDTPTDTPDANDTSPEDA